MGRQILQKRLEESQVIEKTRQALVKRREIKRKEKKRGDKNKFAKEAIQQSSNRIQSFFRTKICTRKNTKTPRHLGQQKNVEDCRIVCESKVHLCFHVEANAFPRMQSVECKGYRYISSGSRCPFADEMRCHTHSVAAQCATTTIWQRHDAIKRKFRVKLSSCKTKVFLIGAIHQVSSCYLQGKNLCFGSGSGTVLDPYSLSCSVWIRIRILKTDTDPDQDPGAQKRL